MIARVCVAGTNLCFVRVKKLKCGTNLWLEQIVYPRCSGGIRGAPVFFFSTHLDGGLVRFLTSR